VETFARNLQKIFAEVRFLTPDRRALQSALRSRLPVICDNQRVLDWPLDHPVIGFQHGVGAVKYEATRSWSHWWLARRQQRAARRPNTLWVACAEWVASSFYQLYGNRTNHVIRYPVDVERFDGRLRNEGSRLVLHDARTEHKGRRLIPHLKSAFPHWRFEPLACRPQDVPDRMRGAAAFVHLSRYEGNSLVCNEAMAMGLPCLFTRVGLLRDDGGPTEIETLDVETAYSDPARLVDAVGRFLQSLRTRRYDPRPWVLQHATLEHARIGWRRVMAELQQPGRSHAGAADVA
jgi:hypothetical protein